MYDGRLRECKNLSYFFGAFLLAGWLTFELGNIPALAGTPVHYSKPSPVLVFSDNIKPLDDYLRDQPNIIHYEADSAKKVFNNVSTSKVATR